MRKLLLLTLFIGFSLGAMEITDFINSSKDGKYVFVQKKYKDGKMISEYRFTLTVNNEKDGRKIGILKDNKNKIEIFLDKNNEPKYQVIYKDGKERKIYKNLKIKDRKGKMLRKVNEVLSLNGKRYNAIRTTYENTSTQEITKGHLILKTFVTTTENVWEDENGVPIKIETEKTITQKTYHTLSPGKVIKQTERKLTEVIERE